MAGDGCRAGCGEGRGEGSGGTRGESGPSPSNLHGLFLSHERQPPEKHTPGKNSGCCRDSLKTACSPSGLRVRGDQSAVGGSCPQTWEALLRCGLGSALTSFRSTTGWGAARASELSDEGRQIQAGKAAPPRALGWTWGCGCIWGVAIQARELGLSTGFDGLKQSLGKFLVRDWVGASLGTAP